MRTKFVTALLMAPMCVGAQTTTARSSTNQGFAGETCNIDNPGSGCDGQYRCAYIGVDFVAENQINRKIELINEKKFAEEARKKAIKNSEDALKAAQIKSLDQKNTLQSRLNEQLIAE